MSSKKFTPRVRVSDEEDDWPVEEADDFRPPGPPAGLRRVVGEILNKWQVLNEPGHKPLDSSNQALFRDRSDYGRNDASRQAAEDEHYLGLSSELIRSLHLTAPDPDPELLLAIWRVVSRRTCDSLQALREAHQQLLREISLSERER